MRPIAGSLPQAGDWFSPFLGGLEKEAALLQKRCFLSCFMESAKAAPFPSSHREGFFLGWLAFSGNG
jgi:hypothetical protein